MKSFAILSVLLSLGIVSSGQSTEPAAPGEADLLMAKSRFQKTIGVSTGITGLTALAAGLVLWLSEYRDGLTPGSIGYDQGKARTGELLVYAGLGFSFVGDRFLWASKKNKTRAGYYAVSPRLKMESAPLPAPAGISARNYPALGITVTL